MPRGSGVFCAPHACAPGLVLPDPVDVVAAERVSALAEHLRGSLDHDALAAEHVLTVRDRLQVPRVDAGTSSTQVVEMHPFRDWPTMERERDAVRYQRLGSFVDGPVSAGASGLYPEPATGVRLRDRRGE